MDASLNSWYNYPNFIYLSSVDSRGDFTGFHVEPVDRYKQIYNDFVNRCYVLNVSSVCVVHQPQAYFSKPMLIKALAGYIGVEPKRVKSEDGRYEYEYEYITTTDKIVVSTRLVKSRTSHEGVIFVTMKLFKIDENKL